VENEVFQKLAKLLKVVTANMAEVMRGSGSFSYLLKLRRSPSFTLIMKGSIPQRSMVVSLAGAIASLGKSREYQRAKGRSLRFVAI